MTFPIVQTPRPAWKSWRYRKRIRTPESRALSQLAERDPPKYLQRLRLALILHRSFPRAADALGIPVWRLYWWVRRYPDLRAGITFPRRGRPFAKPKPPREPEPDDDQEEEPDSP